MVRRLRAGSNRGGVLLDGVLALSLLLLGGYALEFWIYVIALQLFYPKSMHWPFATWLPIHLDYPQEAAFISSFFLAAAAILWNTKRTVHPRQREPTSHNKLSPSYPDTGTNQPS